MSVQSRYIALWTKVSEHDIALYGDFYAKAWTEACWMSTFSRFSPRNVAYAIAALSPQTQWARNLDMARELVAYCHEHHEGERPEREAVPIGGLGRSIDQALDALYDGTLPPGPKVSAFGRNIAGDLTCVTIDRHMLDIGGVTIKERVLCELNTYYLAGRYGFWPAEMQAVLWGKWRQLKGLADV